MRGMAEDEDIRDVLPEDLDAAGYVGPYMFPNNNRRRIPAVLYLADRGRRIAALVRRPGTTSPVLVNAGFLCGGIALVLFGTTRTRPA